jgi:hypothetical protein
MSELINKNDNRATIRWKLLTTASAISLMASASGAFAAGPQIWIDLGWQYSRIGGKDELYIPRTRAPVCSPDLYDGVARIARHRSGCPAQL